VTIVRSHYRYKPPPRKRKPAAPLEGPRIVAGHHHCGASRVQGGHRQYRPEAGRGLGRACGQ
jgi:hypothetical protein